MFSPGTFSRGQAGGWALGRGRGGGEASSHSLESSGLVMDRQENIAGVEIKVITTGKVRGKYVLR